MKKGEDYTGVNVSFWCHDGKGNYLFHRRSEACRDERGCWDTGGGGLKFGESILDGTHRELEEEFAIVPIEVELMGYREVFREHEGKSTHWIAFHHRVLIDPEKVSNNEPEKHSELSWFKLNDLPDPLHSQVPIEIERYKEFLK